MNFAWFNSAPMASARRWAWALTDRVAFAVESVCIANALFWALTWSWLSFRWNTAAHEWGNFWAHYAKASLQARHPVEIVIAGMLLALTGLCMAVRAPKARAVWSPWPFQAGTEAPRASVKGQ